MNLIVANTVIRGDAAGRFNLNDLHKAAGGDPKHRPHQFLRLEQTQALIEEINQCADLRTAQASEMRSDEISKAGIPALVVVNGGPGRGSYGCRELIYAYATWISPAFFLKVIRVYDAYATGNLALPAPAAAPMPATLADLERLLDTAFTITGRDYLSLMASREPQPTKVQVWKHWTTDEDKLLLEARAKGQTAEAAARSLGRSADSCRHRERLLKGRLGGGV